MSDPHELIEEQEARDAASLALGELSGENEGPSTGPEERREEEPRAEDWEEFARGCVREVLETLTILNPGWAPIERIGEEEQLVRLSAPVIAKYAPDYFGKWRHELLLGVAVLKYLRLHKPYVERRVDPNGPVIEVDKTDAE